VAYNFFWGGDTLYMHSLLVADTKKARSASLVRILRTETVWVLLVEES